MAIGRRTPSPANGNYDFTFALFNNSSTNSGQIGSTLTKLDVGVNNGLFTVTLDFGTNFPGASRWLAIGVRTNGATNFTALNPLQELTPTPYAIYAPTAGNAATAGTADSVSAMNIIGTIPAGNLSPVASTNIAGSLSYVASQSTQRQLTAFVTGLQQLGLWQNIIESAFFAPGENTGTSSLVGLNMTPGLAFNCVQTNTGLYLNGSNSYILFTNIPQQNGPFTLIVFETGMGWNQTATADMGGLYSGTLNSGWESARAFAHYQSTSGAPVFEVYDGSEDTVLNSPGGPYYPVTTDIYFRALAFGTDRTNAEFWISGAQPSGLVAPAYGTSALQETFTPALNYLLLGASQDGPGALNFNFNGIIHGFIAVSNYLSAAQIQQLYSLAENTVLTDRRLCMEGDSLTVGYNSYVLTNSSFWGNCTFAADAVAGSHLTNMLNHFYSTVATNMPNGQDIIYPSTVLFWGGENSIGAQDTADQCYGWISEEIANVHALGGQIFVSTIMESDSVTGNPNPFFEAQRVGLNELITANSAGAEGVADPDTMFYNLLGPNYYTNLACFVDGVHCTTLGYTMICTNWNGVVGTAILTTNNYFVGYPAQSVVANIPSGLTTNLVFGTNTLCFTNGILMIVH
jgi:hypothetical protein